MNLLYKTKTYLVGHMQYLEGRDWRQEVTEKLGKIGVTCFDPYKKPFIKDVEEDEASREEMEVWMKTKQYDRVTERMKMVRSYDLNLVDRSDFIIAHLVPDVASWGSAYIYNSLDEIIEMLYAIDGGDKEIDSDRWRLLKREFR